MASLGARRQKQPGHKPAVHPKNLKRKREEEDLSTVQQKVESLNPREDKFELFSQLPLSSATAKGLEASHYRKLTEIQAHAIPYALKSRDLLGAAKTGSGKTLSFLVAVLEQLYRKRWTELDGLGALVLSPTRELAIQIFEVLRKIGRYHTFSAGLVIGGKSLQEERDRLGRMNILVCTPGRMLQHMDQTWAFDVDHLQMLVLDEADRIMDMGFQSSMDAIIEHLPKKRQTILFSATQTKKVSDLARLSLQDPEYVSVHDGAQSATPATLQQNYIVTPLSEKLDTLWSFVRSNLKAKILVFLSSGKQVRFVYEAFRHMQPGISLLHIHGRQKQSSRLQTIDNFSSAKYSCLFATDVAARGLDIPAVDWVVQLDCPEDANTYIHRVGRTARYERDGRAVLFLEPSEESGMLQRLGQKKVSLEKIGVRQKKQQSVKIQLQNMCFKDPELKYLGQKAFVSYVRSIHLQKDKEVFKLSELPLEAFASSLGLPGAPKIKFLKGDSTKSLKNQSRQLESSSDSESGSILNEEEVKGSGGRPRTKYDRMFERRNQDILADHYTKLVNQGVGEESNHGGVHNEIDGFLSVRRRIGESDDIHRNDLQAPENSIIGGGKIVAGIGRDPILLDSKRKEKILKSRKKLLQLKDKGKRIVFDDDGNAHDIYELEDEEQFKQRGAPDAQKTRFIVAEQERLQVADGTDKQEVKAKRKEKRVKRKAMEVLEGERDGHGREAVLVPHEDEIGKDLDGIDLFGDDNESADRAKRPEKWSQSDSESVDRTSPRISDSRTVPRELESLEDLEAVAAGLME